MMRAIPAGVKKYFWLFKHYTKVEPKGMEKIMKRNVTFLAIVFSLFVFSCQHNQITNPPTQTDNGSSVSFYFAKPAGLDSLVVSAKALVSAPGMDSIWSDLAVNDTSVTGTIEDIPAGPHRKFEIFTYDADTNLTYYGHEFADVPSGGAL